MNLDPEERARKRAIVKEVLGDYIFNPWDRNPSKAEQDSLNRDGLTREYFEELERRARENPDDGTPGKDR